MTPEYRAALAGARHRQRTRRQRATITAGGDAPRSQTLWASGFGSPSAALEAARGGLQSAASAVLRVVRSDLQWLPESGNRVSIDGSATAYAVESIRDIPSEPEVGINLQTFEE